VDGVCDDYTGRDRGRWDTLDGGVKMMDLKPGDIIQHYKGGVYVVKCIATHTETKEKMVIYKRFNGNGELWARPEAMFNEKIPRFKKFDEK